MKKFFSFQAILGFFCAIFFMQAAVATLSFDFQSLVPNFTLDSVKSYLFSMPEIKPEPVILAQASGQQSEILQYFDKLSKTYINVDQEKNGDKDKKESITKQLWSATKKDLNQLWQMLSYEKFKELYLKLYPEPTAGMDATLEKGMKVVPKIIPNPATGKDIKKTVIDPKNPEGEYASRRMDKVFNEKRLSDFLGYKFNDKAEVPRIGVALSGGGYRAMILTAGYLKALEDMGLLDATFYVAALSGSTWYVGPWIFQQDPNKKTSIAEFNQNILQRVNHLNLLQDPRKDFDAEKFASTIIFPKVLYEESISSVDIYGAALSHYLLSNLGDKRLSARLLDQKKKVELAQVPFPIYTAVAEASAADHNYDWHEFNPWRIWNLEHDCSFQSYAFGRKFEAGKAQKQSGSYPPEESFGYLMAIFGSAFTVNLNDIIRILFKDVHQKDAKSIDSLKKEASNVLSKIPGWLTMLKSPSIENVKKILSDLLPLQVEILVTLLNKVSDVVIKKATDKKITIGGKEITVGATRFVPAQVYNPYKNYDEVDEALQEKEVLTFVDAGIDYNIPLRPLIRPERDLDLIIIGDASGDAPVGTGELEKALSDLKRFYGLDYTQDMKLSSMTMKVYRPEQETYPFVEDNLAHVQPPVLVYFNFLKDDELLKEGEKDQTLKNIIEQNNLNEFSTLCLQTYCSTFNFNYTTEQFKQLSGIGEFNIRAHQTELKEILDGIANELRIDEAAGFGGVVFFLKRNNVKIQSSFLSPGGSYLPGDVYLLGLLLYGLGKFENKLYSK